MFFFTLFAYRAHGGGASPTRLVHNMYMRSFTMGSSKIKVLEDCFFDTMIT